MPNRMKFHADGETHGKRDPIAEHVGYHMVLPEHPARGFARFMRNTEQNRNQLAR